MNVLERLKINFEDREKKAFYAGDYGKTALDLYFAFTGEPKTNPPTWSDTLKWGAGRGVEEQMGIILKDSGIVKKDYDQKTHGRVEMERHGIKIHGYIDFKTKGGRPIECKSINNANKYDVLKYKRGEPRESYVGQIASYLEYTGKAEGALFVASIDGLNHWWLPVKRIKPGVYRCGKVTVDVDAEYKKWAYLYDTYIVPRKLPEEFIMEAPYKYDVRTLDWRAQSQNAIRKARSGDSVIGDFRVKFSPWKDKILELQGVTPGYTNDELAYILEATAGYTTWFKKGSKKELVEEEEE